MQAGGAAAAEPLPSAQPGRTSPGGPSRAGAHIAHKGASGRRQGACCWFAAAAAPLQGYICSATTTVVVAAPHQERSKHGTGDHWVRRAGTVEQHSRGLAEVAGWLVLRFI